MNDNAWIIAHVDPNTVPYEILIKAHVMPGPRLVVFSLDLFNHLILVLIKNAQGLCQSAEPKPVPVSWAHQSHKPINQS